MDKFIHLHKSRLEDNSNILLLLIPAIFYIFTLGLIIYGFRLQNERRQIASTNQSTVLGKENSLDNSLNKSAK